MTNTHIHTHTDVQEMLIEYKQSGRKGNGKDKKEGEREGRKGQPTPVFLPGESHGQRSLAGYTVRGVTKSRT